MYEAVEGVPAFLRYILYKLRVESNVAMPDLDRAPVRGYFFLLFVGPALCDPVGSHISGVCVCE